MVIYYLGYPSGILTGGLFTK